MLKIKHLSEKEELSLHLSLLALNIILEMDQEYLLIILDKMLVLLTTLKIIYKTNNIKKSGIIMDLTAIYFIITESMLKVLEEIQCIWQGFKIHQKQEEVIH